MRVFPLPGGRVDESELPARFGRAVRRRRLALRLSQEDLAAAAGLHATHISLFERGGGMPTLRVIHQLAGALGMTMAKLMTEVERSKPPADPPPIARGRPKKADPTPDRRRRKE